MPALQVRDFPDDLYEELKTCAKASHRSIAQQTIACVESDLARRREFTAHYGGAYAIDIPPNVREASERARFVDPFAGTALEHEPPEVIEARREKRRRLREQIAELNKHWKGPKPTCEEVARMVREDLDERTDRIIENVENYLAAKREARNDGVGC